jgi:glutathione synthase/RimK-type ligase-like ATP-grasp enzyme
MVEKMIKILPYKRFSKSARTLARALRCKRLTHPLEGVLSRYDIIINWGSSFSTIPFTNKDLNNPINVEIAGNKLRTFQKLKDKKYIPLYTTEKEVVQDWLDEGHTAYGRKYLTSHSGHGIILIQDTDIIPDCPLYTVGQNVFNEYRVHVFNGKIIDVQQKRKRKNTNANRNIRNHSNGWVFCRNNVDVPVSLELASIDAVETLGLDFGAVDIASIYSEDDEGYSQYEPMIFEINTAPGIVNTTVLKYTNAIKEYVYEMSSL